MPPPPVNPTRIKTTLKMAISKLKFVQEKKTALTKQQRRQLADILKLGKETSAEIRVENIIRDDIYVELLEYMELYCELLLARIVSISDLTRTTVDPGIDEAVSSVIYAAPHSELKEMTMLRDMFHVRYGDEYFKSAVDNANGKVPEKIFKRCLVEPPPESLVILYLSEIARTYDAPYSKMIVNDVEDDDDEPSGGEAIKEKENEKKLENPIGEVADSKPQSAAKKDQQDFDLLKARFAALKGGK